MSIEISVIIVNFNGMKFLKECLESLMLNLKDLAFEIIVFDNNSHDASCEYIKQSFTNVRLIESVINYGFGKGNNEAVNLANGEYILLINNDTVVLDYLKPVLDFFKTEKNIGVLGINMVDANKQYMQAGFRLPNIYNMLRLKNLLKINKDFENGNFKKNHYEVGWLCGSFLMMSKKTFIEINGFDPNYFMYVEDVDLCKRISDKKLKRVFYPAASYIHFVGFDSSKNKFLSHGYKIYCSKHFSGLYKRAILFAIKINVFIKNLKLQIKTDQISNFEQ